MQLEKVKQLLVLYEQGLIPTLSQHEVHPNLPRDSRENYLYFTLPVCINFQRSSPAMWASALKTYEDHETQFVFLPEELVKHSAEQIRTALIKHKLALQPNKHVAIWTSIAKTLHEYYHDDPREVIREAQNDAGKLIIMLQGIHRKRFPYLSGPKLSNYWPYILSYYTDVKLDNTHKISIIPDTHVIQSSQKLGITSADATPVQVALAWQELLKDSGIHPSQVHPVLWNWSRNKFLPKI